MRRHAIAGAAILLFLSANVPLVAEQFVAQGMLESPVGQPQALQQSSARQVLVPLVTLSVSNTPVWQALDMLFRGTGLTYTVDPQVAGVQGLVTVDLRNMPFDTALQIVTRNAGLGARKEGTRYIIGPMLLGAGGIMPQSGPDGVLEVSPSGRPGAQKFDITLEKANVLEAMKQILEVARQNYVIDMGLDSAWAGPFGPKVSAKMHGVFLDDLLQALGKSANLVVGRVNSIYTVRPPDGALPFSYAGASAGTKGGGGKVVSGAQTKSGLPTCAKCGRVLDATWLYCPQCGTPMAAK